MTATAEHVASEATHATAHTLETTLDVVKGESFKTHWQPPLTLTWPVPEGTQPGSSPRFPSSAWNSVMHAALIECMQAAPPAVSFTVSFTFTGDYRDQLPPLIHQVAEQYAPVVRSGRWTHGLFEVSLLCACATLMHPACVTVFATTIFNKEKMSVSVKASIRCISCLFLCPYFFLLAVWFDSKNDDGGLCSAGRPR